MLKCWNAEMLKGSNAEKPKGGIPRAREAA
jgi:hypothetical protein